MVCQVFLAYLWDVPAGKKGMNAVHESSIIAHLFGHGAKEVTYMLLMFDINLEIANENEAAISADALLAATEFT
jgi:hypothetical protein